MGEGQRVGKNTTEGGKVDQSVPLTADKNGYLWVVAQSSCLHLLKQGEI